MCEEPKTPLGAAQRYWTTKGMAQISLLTEYCTTQQRLVQGAFMAGAEWERKREQAAQEQAHVPECRDAACQGCYAAPEPVAAGSSRGET